MEQKQAALRRSRPAPPTAREANTWDSYWEELDGRARVFREQSREYVMNLLSKVPLPPEVCVLDFGCGFGHVAGSLAPMVGEISLWDASTNMLRHARRNVSGIPNVRFADLDPDTWDGGAAAFDLVLVNSVIQYMTQDEFAQWLIVWRRVLKPDGRIVISDVIPANYDSLRDFTDILRLSARRGFLRQAIFDGLHEIAGYARKRQSRPLTRYDRGDLIRHAERAGLTVEFLPRNLTHFPRRISMLLTHTSKGAI